MPVISTRLGAYPSVMDDVEGHVGPFQRGDAPHERVAADFLAAIVASSDDAIYSKDREALITSWNRSAERLYGYPPDEALGRPISILIPEDKRGEEFDILYRILKGEHVEHYETRRQRKDGRIVEVSISVSPVHDQNGEIIEAAVISRDITDRKQLERRIAALREAQSKSAEKQALELNDEVVQGLAAAKLALETAEYEKGIRVIGDTLARAQGIVSRLLEERQDGIEPGDLVREGAAEV